jgi:hypothetical protein
METVIGLLIGVGLAAATGFRVFVPMLGMSIAVLSGYVAPSSGFEWLGTWPAFTAFSTALVIEIAAYYIPWIDNATDALMTPAAVVAGTLLTASVVGDISPFLKWSLAIVAGAGVSGIVQLGTVALRAGASGTTGGLTNPLISTVELVGAVLVTGLAIFLPLLCLIVVIWVCYKMIEALKRMPVRRLWQREKSFPP